MVNPNNPVPPGPGPTPPTQPTQPSGSAAPPSYKGGQVEARPMKWLGMQFSGKEAQQLWNILIQNINSQIQKSQEKALKAIKKLGKSATGEDTDDDS